MGRKIDNRVKQQSYTEVGECRTEEDGGRDARTERFIIMIGSGGFEQILLVDGSLPGRTFLDCSTLRCDEFFGCFGGTAGGAGEADVVARTAIKHAAEVARDADRPGDRRGLHVE